MSERFERRPLAVAVVMALSAPVLAQSQETALPEVKVKAAPEGGFKTESTPSATRTETPLRDIPQFINEIPQAVIRSQGGTTLPDALRNAPGITYAAAEGGTQSNQVLYLRGFPLNQDIYIDGVRDMGEYNRDLFATESVEVLKGPSALLFGRGSAGGLVNQTAKTADLLPRKELSLTFGSYQQKRAVGDVNVRTSEDSAVRMLALAEDSGFYRYPQGVQKLGFAPSFWKRLGTGTEMTLSYSYLNTHDVTDYGQPTLTSNPTGAGSAADASRVAGQAQMPPVPATTYYGFANHDFADHQTQIATFKLEHEFSSDLSVRNTLRWASYRRQMEATISTLRNTDATGAPVTPNTPLELLMVTRNHDGNRTRDNDDDAILNQTDFTWKTSAWGMNHTVLAGLELSRERLNRWNYILDANPATPAVDTPTSATPLLSPDPNTLLLYSKTPNLRARSSGDMVALYAQDQVELNEHWRALGGLRFERFTGRAETTTIATGATAAGPFERTDNMVSGRAGLIWQPTRAQSYYVSTSNSFNPSGELGVYAGTAQTNLNAVNQGLDPEENRNNEIGGQWDLVGGLTLRSALFRTEKINQRINNSITGVTELAGKRRVEGLEVALSGTLARNWDIYANAVFQGGRIVKATANEGNTPLGVPDVAASLWTVYHLPQGWEVGGGIRASSKTWLTDANNGETPAYHVLDATLAYVQPKYEVRLNLYNMSDEVYYYGGYQNSPNRVLPAQPRSAAITVRYLFD